MMQRVYVLVSALAIAVMVYAAVAGLIFRKITSWMHISVTSPRSSVPPGSVQLFGQIIPAWTLIAGCAALITLCLAADLLPRLQRRHRAKHDLCLECGEPILRWPSKCPRCGAAQA